MKDKKNHTGIYATIAIAVLLGGGFILATRDKTAKTDQLSNIADEQDQPQPPFQNDETGGPRGGRPFEKMDIDYAQAAETLGVGESDVEAALNVEAGKRLNLEEAAETLGVTVEALREALGIPDGMPMGGPSEMSEGRMVPPNGEMYSGSGPTEANETE